VWLNAACADSQRVEISPRSAVPDSPDHDPLLSTTDDSRRRHNRPFFGISLKIISALAFTSMSALVKYATSGGLKTPVPLGEMIFFRSLFALLPVILWLSYARPLSAAFRTRNIKGHIRRGLIGSGGMFFGFSALSFLPLPDTTAIGYAAPLLSVILAAVFLKEVVRIYRWTAVVIGLVGVSIMFIPHLRSFGADASQPDAWKGVVLALCGAVCAAFATIEVRKLTSTEHTGAIVVYFSLTTTTMSLLTFAAGLFRPEIAWVWPTGSDFLLLAMVGFFGGIGQILLTHCYRFADASVIAPFDYTSMVWALLFGWLVFSQIPDMLVLIGAAIVITSGIFVILREHALGIANRRQREAGPPRAL